MVESITRLLSGLGITGGRSGSEEAEGTDNVVEETGAVVEATVVEEKSEAEGGQVAQGPIGASSSILTRKNSETPFVMETVRHEYLEEIVIVHNGGEHESSVDREISRSPVLSARSSRKSKRGTEYESSIKSTPKPDESEEATLLDELEAITENIPSYHTETANSSENNSIVNVRSIIPCCKRRKSVCPKNCCECEDTCCLLDPCCFNPCILTPAQEHIRLKEETKALKRCIRQVRRCAMADANEMVRNIMCGQCSCCCAREQLKPCKSHDDTKTAVLGRETWLCVPLPGSSYCGGYTPSGWGRMLKRCQNVTGETSACCVPCSFPSECSAAVNRRKKCLPMCKPCPPCPHLCLPRALSKGVCPYTPCCPLYFPAAACNSQSYIMHPCCSDDQKLVNCCKDFATQSPGKTSASGPQVLQENRISPPCEQAVESV